MPSGFVSVLQVLAEARDQVAECLDAPEPAEDVWEATKSELEQDWRFVGGNLRWAMDRYVAEFAPVSE